MQGVTFFPNLFMLMLMLLILLMIAPSSDRFAERPGGTSYQNVGGAYWPRLRGTSLSVGRSLGGKGSRSESLASIC